jgi:hypothetical protein
LALRLQLKIFLKLVMLEKLGLFKLTVICMFGIPPLLRGIMLVKLLDHKVLKVFRVNREFRASKESKEFKARLVHKVFKANKASKARLVHKAIRAFRVFKVRQVQKVRKEFKVNREFRVFKESKDPKVFKVNLEKMPYGTLQDLMKLVQPMLLET